MCLEVDSWSILSCWRAYRSMLVIRMFRVILAVDLTYLQLTFHREVWCHDSQFFIMENSIIDVLNTLIYTSLVYVVFVLMQHSIRMMLLVTNTNMRQASAGIFCDCLLQTPSVLWHCWLGGRKGIRPVKNLSGGVLSGARCGLAYGPADGTATHCLLLQ